MDFDHFWKARKSRNPADQPNDYPPLLRTASGGGPTGPERYDLVLSMYEKSTRHRPDAPRVLNGTVPNWITGGSPPKLFRLIEKCSFSFRKGSGTPRSIFGDPVGPKMDPGRVGSEEYSG